MRSPLLSPHTFIFMGVSGCGKSTIGRAFADATAGTFLDGDDFHPPANIEKMSKAVPLDDGDRDGWIEALRDAIDSSDTQILCIACSSLKKKHRAMLRETRRTLTFVFLHGSKRLLTERLAQRSGHFMASGLLDSQLADLETPTDALQIDISSSPDQILADLRRKFSL